jgi:hypothetical protein
MVDLQRIKDAGLTYHSADPEDIAIIGDRWEYQHKFWIYKPATKDTGRLLVMQPGNEILVEHARIELHLLKGQDQWTLYFHEYIPGPGPTDFICAFPQLDAAIDSVLDFYFGQATLVLDTWLVPLHRHPELKHHYDRLITTIANAEVITQKQLKAILEERRAWAIAHYKTVEPMKHALTSQFLDIPHCRDPHQILYLRRDLHEAYIAFQDCSNP